MAALIGIGTLAPVGQLPLLLAAVVQPHRSFCGRENTGGGAAAPSTRQNRRPTLLRRPTQPELNCSSPLKVGWELAAVGHNMEVAAPPPAPPNGAKQTSPTMTPTDAAAPAGATTGAPNALGMRAEPKMQQDAQLNAPLQHPAAPHAAAGGGAAAGAPIKPDAGLVHKATASPGAPPHGATATAPSTDGAAAARSSSLPLSPMAESSGSAARAQTGGGEDQVTPEIKTEEASGGETHVPAPSPAADRLSSSSGAPPARSEASADDPPTSVGREAAANESAPGNATADPTASGAAAVQPPNPASNQSVAQTKSAPAPQASPNVEAQAASAALPAPREAPAPTPQAKRAKLSAPAAPGAPEPQSAAAAPAPSAPAATAAAEPKAEPAPKPQPAAAPAQPTAPTQPVAAAQAPNPPLDPMAALLELSRAADVLSQLGGIAGAADVAAPSAQPEPGPAAAAKLPATNAGKPAAPTQGAKPEAARSAGTRQRLPRAASRPEASVTAKLEERMRRMKEGSVMTPIGSVRLGDRLDIRWLEGDGQFYTATVKALTDAGVTVFYPETSDWDEWDETLPLKDIVASRVKKAAAMPLKASLKRKHPSGGSPREGDGAGSSWTEREDAALRRMVREEGFGNWEDKAAHFISSRTPNALRQRWCSHLSHMATSGDDEASELGSLEADQMAASGWSPREDQQLRQMIGREGTGSWEVKSRKFGTDRSAAALRFRWYKLSKDSGEVETTERDHDVSRWSTAEDLQLQNMVRMEGPGNWRQKAETFNTDRSADALRFRWYIIQKEEEAAAAAHAARERQASADGGEVPTSWTAEEDEELRQLCIRDGTGNWSQKAEDFSTRRTANALRHRWANFIHGGGAGGKDRPPPIDVRPVATGLWSAEEDAELRRAVAAGGAADWKAKSERFSTRRSEGAMRRRWAILENPDAAAEAGAEDGDEEGRTPASTPSSWLPNEDAQLRQLVRAEGSGNWQHKANRFNTARSAGALRFRWYVLKEEDEAAAAAAVDEGPAESAALAGGWTTSEDKQLSRMVSDEGTGNWQQKAERFSTSRTANGLRHRWTHYLNPKRGGAVASPRGGDMSHEDLLDEGSSPRGLRPPQNRLTDWLGLTVELANGRRGVVEGGGHGYFEVRMNERPAAGEPVVVKKRAHELQLVREKSPRAVGVVAAEMIGRRVHVDGTGEQGVIESSGHGYFTVRIAHGETIRKRGHELIVDDERSPAKAARADEAGNRFAPLGPHWSAAEDTQLHELVDRHGAGHWKAKAEGFSAEKSGSALRRRWAQLKDKGVVIDPKTGADLTVTVPEGSINEEDEEWRPSLEQGFRCQCLYSKTWYEAVVVAEQSDDQPARSTRRNSESIKIHFLGWKSYYDEWVPRLSQRLWTLGSTPQWFKKYLGGMVEGQAESRLPPHWTPSEDLLLQALCKDGPGDWEEKAKKFTEANFRTAADLSARWDKLQAEEQRDAESEAEEEEEEEEEEEAAAAARPAPRRDPLNRTPEWTEEEDELLRSLVESTGAGDWKNKLKQFATRRSEGGLRRRWYLLRDEMAEAAEAQAAAEGVAAWTPAEDAELIKMIEESGASGWQQMAERFSTDRSGDSLRNRWSYVLKHQGAAGGDDDEDGGSRGERRSLRQLGSGPDEAWRKELEVGSVCACLSQEEMFTAKVIEVREDERPGMVKVHYQGWSSNYDEWISRTSSRLDKEEAAGQMRPRREPEPVVREKAGPAPPGGAWSEAEDKQLRSMCAKEGPGDWDGKASRFTANRGRTASSLRQRWAKLQAAAAAGGGALEGDVSRWTEEEDLQLRKLVVKLGTNDWKQISAQFGTKRSSSALRRRWYHLREVDSDESGSEDEEGEGQANVIGGWTAAEDAELCKLVKEGGTGDWKTKAERFSSRRSAGAIRFRWYHLRDTGVAAAPAGVVAPVSAAATASTGWTAGEDAQLLALVKKHGVGEWQAKAAAFATERSSSALRHRWSCYLAAKTGSVATAPKKESMPPPAPRGERSSPRRATGPSAAAAAAPAQPAPVASPPKLTDEELARELQRELSGVRKRTRETVRYDPMAR